MSDEISVRGLIEGGQGLGPLRRFKGKLAGYEVEKAQGQRGEYDVVHLNFGPGIEVLQSVEPYNLPTTVITISYNKKKKSKWGYFSESLAKFLQPTQDLKDTVNKTYGMVATDSLDGRPSPETTKIWSKEASREDFPDGMVPTPCWTVYELEGAAVTAGGTLESAADKLLKELIGKSRAEFNKIAFTQEYVRSNPALQKAIIDKSFIAGMIATGKAHEDANGVFQAGPEVAQKA